MFSGDKDITRIRLNRAYWADGGIVSTVEDAVTFLQALKEEKIIRQDTLALMHASWHQLPKIPFQYGYGTMKFEVPPSSNWGAKAPMVWGHTGSTGVFPYYAEDLDVYMAGTIDQTEDKMTPIILIIKIMQSIASLRAVRGYAVEIEH